MSSAEYDYIVVGAGSAGAVVAGRLSEDPGTSVLLIEAGGSHKHMNVQIPAAFSTQFRTDLDWDFTTDPEPGLDGRTIYHPRARMLGGCSAMNAMIYIRGNRADYDGWAKTVAPGWSYDEVLPYFVRSEHNSRGASTYHGADGPMFIEDHRDPNPLSATLLAAMLEADFVRNDDFNGAGQEGAGFYQVTQKRGRRWTTADGFLTPARKRPNLTVLTKAQALRVTITAQRATGVEVSDRRGARTLRARREVVLSAGAFNTPQLLMLSGIGPAEHLREHGIRPIIDNPNVGDHMMDHPMFLMNFETDAKGTLAEAQSLRQLAKYATARKGMLTSNVGEVGGFFHTRSGLEGPDMQLIGAPGYFHNHGFDTHDRPAFAFGASLVGSLSRGRVSLRSASPTDKIRARFNYLTAPEDLAAVVEAVKVIRAIADSEQLRPFQRREIHPGAQWSTTPQIEQAVRAEIEHTYHPACTARIGSESDGVVDAELRVHGIAGLRVADASVFPTIPRGNTHAPTLMVGEKAADLIRKSA